jgi:MOSC domain-containing protein YiiM
VARLASVNIGSPRPTEFSSVGVTGIDKRPVTHPVAVAVPGSAERPGPSGLAGDAICDAAHHGGVDQAVYAYAREDLDRWETELGRPLPSGVFGENLTTSGLDVSGALIGERWQVGTTCVLEVSVPRIPCRTFAGWLAENGWVQRFTAAGDPGAYLRVVTPGVVQAGDAVVVVHRPEHAVTIGLTFRALTTDRDLLPELLAAGDALPVEAQEQARRQARRRAARRGEHDGAESARSGGQGAEQQAR